MTTAAVLGLAESLTKENLGGKKVVFYSSLLCASIVFSNHDDERVTLSSTPPDFAIIPRIWTHHTTRPNTSAPNQGRGAILVPHERENADRRKKIGMAGDYCYSLKMKDNFSIYHKPQVWQNQLLKMHTWHVLCSLQSPHNPLSPLIPRAKRKKKMVEVYLLYFLIIALWCKMCRKCLRFCHLKHWRVCICIVSLESFRLVILLIAIAYCVTNVSWHRTQILPFTRWPPLWIMYFSSQCTPFYLKRFVIGKDLKERLLLWQNFTVCKCSDGSYNVKLIPLDQFQSLIVDSDVILHSLLS